MVPLLKDSVCAIIVTHNRLSMLRDCVRAVREQSHPVSEIIVVDNESTDGTRNWLSEQNGLHVVQQANLGGAGGFHNGIKIGVERGHDWLWCMDDDGYPETDCLMRLLDVQNRELWFRAPLVLARENAAQLAFGLRLSDGRLLLTPEQFGAVSQNGLLSDVACPFNGVLIHRQIIQSIGLPLSGMFLWGDEAEYMLRVERAGYQVATLGAARFHHPPDRMVEHFFKFFGRELCVVYVNHPLRDYLAIRNYAYILRQYFGLGSAIRHAIRYALFYGKLRGLPGMLWALGAAQAGLCGDWRGHQRYLN